MLAALFLPAAALVLAVGLLVGGVAVPVARRARVAEIVGGLRARRAAQLSAELVETLRRERGARGVRPRGGTARARCAGPTRELVRIARRDALADGLGDGLRLVS